ncbi:pentapeptide repeat-containing protein, partial [Kamptonema animale CS-326]|uniref:pentapeptide repeat-containing protein n=1 Tax=Kamptonema animale TaxID=92934 RepID=UPI00232F3C0F
MKAQELLKRYAEGRRDFRGENLRGLSFKGKDLSGADFSETDIRGTNFSRANLTGAKFVEAKAGLQKRRVIGLLIFCCLLSGVLGSYIYFLAYFMTLIFYDKPSNIIGWISLFITFSLNFILIYRGFNAVAFAFTAFAFSVAGAVTVAFAFAGALTLAVAVVFAVAGAFAGALTFV